ncbi:carboxylesterase/lipase family protein [Rhodohalobacter sulfatireducens]|uniref:Carboxylesterase family protein n=1 Tax=Rhodohalobacter sulfatireducens TaxID=2911366 RepID=A0ABS9KB16_9BACT|nr:carboxylesterase family protein [Rhodohalobacter sulfatireducens]MCG2588031.1 carboxylesterase family protein [Rhodohalobacter sulfatireducens]
MKTNRRNFLQTMGLGAAGLGLGSIPGLSKNGVSADEPGEQVLIINDDTAITDTQYGKVHGFILNDIYNFRGIPYGASTAGENRFMPPQKPEPWGDDVYPAVWWGDSAPQIMEGRYSNSYQSWQDHWNYDNIGEDCLKLNVWTPSIGDNQKRPVLVWLHGGGYTNGNGIEQDGYHGANFSRNHDTVFVSINHRLGPIGFSDLSGVGGSKFADSGNVGALDMVAALEWVRDNIENFDGDPGNVTIMGQSGGGAKVCTLMAMEKAQGLFHKAVPLSGSTLDGIDQERSQGVGQYILEEAGLSEGDVEKLQEIPSEEYLRIANEAARKYREDHGGSGFGSFGPVADGRNLPKSQYFSDPNGLSSDIPMLICSTFHEWSVARNNPEMEEWTFDQVKESLAEQAGFSGGLGEKAGPVVDAYCDAFPDKKPVEIMIMVISNRQGLIETANAKVQQQAPVYVAWFGWEPPMFNGRMRAFHCLDICFWFDNTDRMLTHTGGGARPRRLSQKMSAALNQFMRTGDPNVSDLPEWTTYSTENGETMILNDECRIVNDPDREARQML